MSYSTFCPSAHRRATLLATSTLLAMALLSSPSAADPLPDTTLSYTIEAEFEPEGRQLTGAETIRWRHPGQAPVSAVPLHLYLNAFSHTGTTWMQRGDLRGRARWDDLEGMYGDIWGYTEIIAVSQVTGDGEVDLTHRFIQPDDHNPLDRTLAEVTLAEPVAPGESLELKVRWQARMPIPMARTGAVGDYVLAAQWFPKLAAYETVGRRGAAREGFSAQQFHGPTEFYADFADYDVALTLPAGWVAGATGRRVDDRQADGARTLRFRQRAVHDFAFCASASFVAFDREHKPAGQDRPVALRYLLPRGTEDQLPRWERAVEVALDQMSQRVGPYPWDTLTVVFPPYQGARTSGMEYPTFITGLPGDPIFSAAPVDDFRFPEVVVIHELVHEYFYGIIANNEREEAFLDEGFTTYWEGEVTQALTGGPDMGTLLGRPVSALDYRGLGLRRWAPSLSEPIARRPTWLFYPGSYGVQVYPRTALTLSTAAGLFGQPAVDVLFSAYYRRFAFEHPALGDFLAVAADVGPPQMAAYLQEAFHAPRMPDYRVVHAQTSPWSPPRGRLPDGEGSRPLIDDPEGDARRALQPADLPADGQLLIEVQDPGWATPDGRTDGTVRRFTAAPQRPPTADPEDALYLSHVRVRGPAWRHLPVEVRFEFTDGAAWSETWDGHAAWRAWRITHTAPLEAVTIDPDRNITLDVFPENNAERLEPDRAFAANASGWLMAVSQWLAQGVTLWL